jgi:bacteriorhodopsin
MDIIFGIAFLFLLIAFLLSVFYVVGVILFYIFLFLLYIIINLFENVSKLKLKKKYQPTKEYLKKQKMYEELFGVKNEKRL